MRVAFPPSMGRVYKSPSSSKTIVLPSGERSSESQVPSSVVNLSGVVGVSGRPRAVVSLPRPPRCAFATVLLTDAMAARIAIDEMRRRILASGGIKDSDGRRILADGRGGGK